MFHNHPPSPSCFPIVDIWSAALAKGVWKDTADCGERQLGVQCAGAWGNQVLWSVRLGPPSWWSKTAITATDDRGCWPDQMWTVMSALMSRIEAMPARKILSLLAPQQCSGSTQKKNEIMLNQLILLSAFIKLEFALLVCNDWSLVFWLGITQDIAVG